jgi:hypothetical protein
MGAAGVITATLIVIGAIIIVTIAFVLIARSGGKPNCGGDGTGTIPGSSGSSDGDGGD